MPHMPSFSDDPNERADQIFDYLARAPDRTDDWPVPWHELWDRGARSENLKPLVDDRLVQFRGVSFAPSGIWVFVTDSRASAQDERRESDWDILTADLATPDGWSGIELQLTEKGRRRVAPATWTRPYTLAEWARVFRVSENTIAAWFQSGEVLAKKRGKYWVIAPHELPHDAQLPK